MIKSYHDLEVYQRASRLFSDVYRLTKAFPREDGFEIGSQMRRAANSVPANIAEGYCKSDANFKKHLTDSLGSCNEMISHLEAAQSINLLSVEICQQMRNEYTIVGKQIYRLRESWHTY